MDDQGRKPSQRFRPGFWRQYGMLLGLALASWALLLLLDQVIDSESGELVLVFVRLAVTIAFVILFFRFIRRERDRNDRAEL
ncbi:hypothetical protein ASD11_06385 [Aeromicrobium sp. Root495]|uniref:hypothetical protein n=1 Tax=Aeromicrobium sp. Root495 TaxID=1736550 RepID=UPI0006FEE9DA|nr:hypothetical protein [Aeromicrobium sp. Root495]KQY59206.1 hypothetical protein ASD11_06385 [Aeromicrobium sp. Root495]RYJ04715.1 MAG: hypothetical protein EON52_15345 [Actinomycetales bacterium]